ISLAAWSWMAATTLGWQWPVALTAMPAVKSRNRLPSTSSITAPLPRAQTSGEMRVYDGDMYCSSRPGSSRAFGPGGAVLTSGTVQLSNSHIGSSLRNQSHERQSGHG